MTAQQVNALWSLFVVEFGCSEKGQCGFIASYTSSYDGSYRIGAGIFYKGCRWHVWRYPELASRWPDEQVRRVNEAIAVIQSGET